MDECHNHNTEQKKPDMEHSALFHFYVVFKELEVLEVRIVDTLGGGK
jgi:hypothetical protein